MTSFQTTCAGIALFAALLPAQEAKTPERAPAPPFQLWCPRRPADEADFKVAKWGPRNLPSKGYAFFAAKILPVTSAPIIDGVVITRNGVI
ncbi:MAG TPA: hypothetical protein ENI87_04280, partial [bacterium]|nr:hypothetical protein [bacterium]